MHALQARIHTQLVPIQVLSVLSLLTVQQGYAKVKDGKLPPLASIVCNAYYWNLAGSEVERTPDGYEKAFQVNHIAHAALVLRLLGSFCSEGNARVVLFSSDAHWPGKNSLEKYPPSIPEDLELPMKPPPDQTSDNVLGRGFQRYAVSKLAVVMWMCALNRYLERDPNLYNITAIAINPGNLSDSRALRVNTPPLLTLLSKFVIKPLQPLLRLVADPTMRTAAEAGVDVIDLATNAAHPGERGYFTLLERDTSSPESLDEETQQRLWTKTLEWARITRENTALAIDA
ncbi:Short-chain dehydrogenase [Rasamsonia emersonii CBS 393.64]|uniref:Short-chain dehydrogenase n=1 Tax=Rasamsonia emersonii (strain ATCC 16479 / CBS 393.64 / IMI 116815) TaxID=1408163 RepID=A0A0F4YJD8_RASE3|nr:Short-chain dehydrogenase [Rasamsonia emersonii CBS 393.64]KKA18215.1 Short-chain dehydrogenase [Rasamsonia emersonii CBS 393.64]